MYTVHFFQGSLGDFNKRTSSVRVPANDDPYGVVKVSDSNRPIIAAENEIGICVQ